MTADILREAATLMRERAEAALTSVPGKEAIWHSQATLMGNGSTQADAQHIASWHPAVALAVADWLELFATYADSGNEIPAMRGRGLKQALAVARAYLGEES